MYPDSQPLVSIVIPAHNQEDFLREAILSVLEQDYPRIELLVIDDGSTDGTKDLLQTFQPPVRWESQSNAGQANTLNKGWAQSSGDILGYLSADDSLMPSAVSRAVALLSSNISVVATYPDFELMDPASRTIRTVMTMEFSSERLIGDLECLPGPGAFFRRQAWQRAGPWVPHLRQLPDYEFWIRLALQGPFARIPKVLARFRVHDQSQTFHAPDASRAEEPVTVMRQFFDRPDLPASVRTLRPKGLANAHLLSAQLHARAKRWRESWSHVRRGAAIDASTIFTSRSARKLLNAMVNRTGHRALWRVRNWIRKP